MQPFVSTLVHRAFLRSGRLAGVALAAIAFAGAESKADVISASSTGFNISAELSLTLLSSLGVEASVGPASYSSVTSPPPFASTDSLANLSVSAGSIPLVGTLLGVSTGLLTTSADSNVDGLGLTGTTGATATIDGLSIDVLDLLLAPSILSITAEAITTTAEVAGGYGTLTGAGSTLFAGLSISLLGIDLITLDGTVDANTGLDVASILGGVSIILNEQVAVGNGVDSLAFTTNAIRVSFDNVGIAGIGTLDGDLIISHAEAEQFAVAPAVPEPASASLLGVGLAAAALVARRRRTARG